jgi:competence protein ComFC
VISAVPFTGRARDVVLGFKYRNRRQLAGHLAGLLVNRLLAAGIRPGVDVDVVTWAPTSSRRRRQRGFDQAQLVAEQVARQLGVRSRRLLEREADHPAQTGRGRVERLQGPSFRSRPDVAGRRVLVIDDVVTTGATLRSAAESLRSAGAIDVVSAAVASTPGGVASRRQRWGEVVTGPWPATPGAGVRRSA